MKLSLTLLVIFGLVAFIGAAPAEEKREIPEELKPEDDLPAKEQDKAAEDEDEDIPEDELSELTTADVHKSTDHKSPDYLEDCSYYCETNVHDVLY
ncbi:hypothetical protein AC249_AIPGENE18005 [Exaiptasia diaphana]|nr:hypothetical protein AC249_AIPGENE18005 [Exaiptasia diaphana]